MSTNFVTATGFVKKTLAEIKVELETGFQAVFGTDIDLDSTGPIGQLIGILAKREADLWDGAEEIYTSRNPNEATGTSLDNLAAETNVTRIAASASRVENVLLFGTEGTVVAAGKQARQSGRTETFSLETTTTITKTKSRYGYLTPETPVVGHVYAITIDSVPYSITYAAGDLVTLLLAELAAWTGGTASASVDGTSIILQATEDFALTETATFTDVLWASGGIFNADVISPLPVPENTLIEIVTPVSGWDSVTNIQAGGTGREVETDDELRIRRQQDFLKGSATDDAIKSALLNDVVGVSAVTVTSNRSMATDIYGRPPKSFEVVIEGGSTQDIADKIWEKSPSGIESYGTTTATVVDANGDNQSVKFSRPTNMYIWVRLTRTLYTEEVYPVDGDAQIKAAIVSWSLLNMKAGTDVIYQRLSIPVYTIPGVKDITIEVAATTTPEGSPSYASADIAMNGRELAVFDTTRIVVQ